MLERKKRLSAVNKKKTFNTKQKSCVHFPLRLISNHQKYKILFCTLNLCGGSKGTISKIEISAAATAIIHKSPRLKQINKYYSLELPSGHKINLIKTKERIFSFSRKVLKKSHFLPKCKRSISNLQTPGVNLNVLSFSGQCCCPTGRHTAAASEEKAQYSEVDRD